MIHLNLSYQYQHPRAAFAHEPSSNLPFWLVIAAVVYNRLAEDIDHSGFGFARISRIFEQIVERSEGILHYFKR